MFTLIPTEARDKADNLWSLYNLEHTDRDNEQCDHCGEWVQLFWERHQRKIVLCPNCVEFKKD